MAKLTIMTNCYDCIYSDLSTQNIALTRLNHKAKINLKCNHEKADWLSEEKADFKYLVEKCGDGIKHNDQ